MSDLLELARQLISLSSEEIKILDNIESHDSVKSRDDSKPETHIMISSNSQPIYVRRMDLINGLPWGGQQRITQILDVSFAHVSKVLNGHKNANTELNQYVILLAQQMVNRAKNNQSKKL